MNPETLIGMELGQGVLQRLVGQGTMGAVYLATQKQTQYQIAVKVFLPASPLGQSDYQEFLTRMEQEIARTSSLNHPAIVPVLHYDIQGKLPTLTMPYIAGESLQQRLARSGPLPFPQIQAYLEQLASALDYAHDSGVLHRDLKPTNILLTDEDKLLVGDFGLAGLTTEKNFATVRRPQPGMLDYIAPEYVLGKTIDQRADLYALGIVLYQMVTGSTPFQGSSLGEVAMQHVKVAPPHPRSLRSDLPQGAEQVILRALAKRPTDRYSQARDLASAFRLALETAQLLQPVQFENEPNGQFSDPDGEDTTTLPRISAVQASLFNPRWQSIEATPAGQAQATNFQEIPQTPAISPEAEQKLQEWSTQTLNSRSGAQTSTASGASRSQDNPPQRTGLLRFANFQANATRQLDMQQEQAQNASSDTLKVAEQTNSGTEELRFAALHNAPQNTTAQLSQFAAFPTMNDKTTGTIKLSEAVKIVQVPVAGQPGRFVTGFLPMQTDEQPLLEKKPQKNTRRMKIVSICLIILVLLAGSGTFLLVHNKNSAAAPKAHTTPTRIVGKATPKATPTTASTIILADSLNQNIHNWQVGTQGTTECAFKDGAYHIINHDDQTGASALLPDETLKSPFSYTLTMAQIEGDTDSPNNQFGMILDASIENKDGNQIDKFYAFEVLNKDGGEYQFWKYDNSQDSNNPWTKLWNKDLGDEFHQGKGADKTNTFKVSVKDDSFTFTVNGKQIDTFKDSSFSSGSVGMMVNLKDSEVAFSNLLLASS